MTKIFDKCNNNFCIGILATIDTPLLPHFINAILDKNLNNIVVICDSKLRSHKDKQIWYDRTGGIFEKINKKKIDIYGLANKKIPFYFVENHNDNNTANLIKSLSIDVLLNAGTPRKLKRNILDITRHGIVNIHPGILPFYRGCSAVEWALFNNDEIGNTAHFMTEDYDEGNIIFIESYKFSVKDDYRSIRTKVYERGCILAAKSLRHLLEHNILSGGGDPQDHSVAKYWNPIPHEKLSKAIELADNGQYKYQVL